MTIAWEVVNIGQVTTHSDGQVWIFWVAGSEPEQRSTSRISPRERGVKARDVLYLPRSVVRAQFHRIIPGQNDEVNRVLCARIVSFVHELGNCGRISIPASRPGATRLV